MGFDPITSVIDLVKTGVDKIWPDAGEKEKNELAKYLEQMKGQLSLILAEMNGNWLQRSWRPIFMLVTVAIVANNYLLYPYLKLFWPQAPLLTLPPEMWSLMKIGLGGYVVGRSVEKSVSVWKK